MDKKSKKIVLGRGLNSLLEDSNSKTESIIENKITKNISLIGKTIEIDIDKIALNPMQPRTRFNKENQNFVEKKKDELNKKNTEVKNKFLAISKIINNKTFNFNKESKENGELYGSIKPREITNLIKEKVNAEVNPSQIILKDELNKIGIFKVEVNFHTEVKANISIKIDKIQSK